MHTKPKTCVQLHGTATLQHLKSHIKIQIYKFEFLLHDIIICIILSSSVVERSTVNRVVVGSKPTWGGVIKFEIYFTIVFTSEAPAAQ